MDAWARRDAINWQGLDGCRGRSRSSRGAAARRAAATAGPQARLAGRRTHPEATAHRLTAQLDATAWRAGGAQAVQQRSAARVGSVQQRRQRPCTVLPRGTGRALRSSVRHRRQRGTCSPPAGREPGDARGASRRGADRLGEATETTSLHFPPRGASRGEEHLAEYGKLGPEAAGAGRWRRPLTPAAGAGR